MVKVVRSFPAPESLAEERKKTAGKYDKPDVIERLKKDFHNKCYICEMKDLQDPNVEHLLPHKNGKYQERKFDWENLFWSCGHCNGIKNNGKYDEGISEKASSGAIDCFETYILNPAVSYPQRHLWLSQPFFTYYEKRLFDNLFNIPIFNCKEKWHFGSPLSNV